ncbi:MAG: FKBP-type peptidyl-prolyl cis-trans isomerase N-terminal domain-containing protein, partial [Acinetobacter pseudolwoffii]|nr:FKBP-type peptidyl-prolyl cis-trans isomerase N-terminal domain-containing protein [Acinetobacter pseudolwoffii]
MSKALPIAVAVLLGGAALVPVYYATQNPAAQTTKASKDASAVSKISYALGYEVAHQTPPELDINSFVTGVREGHARTEPAYTEEELQAAYEQFQKEMQQKQLDSTKQAQASSDSFLTENAKKAGVKTTASGLQYLVTKEGTGKQPAASSIVKVHYTGKLVDGTV